MGEPSAAEVCGNNPARRQTRKNKNSPRDMSESFQAVYRFTGEQSGGFQIRMFQSSSTFTGFLAEASASK